MRPKYVLSILVLALFVILGIFIGQISIARAENEQLNADIDLVVKNLRQFAIDTPSIVKPGLLLAMESAGKTKRIDALELLINDLAYNYSPYKSLETLSINAMIPSIPIMKNYYKEQALPSLYVKGISTNKAWMRERCALAIRYIATPEEIESLNKVFSLNETSNPSGKLLYEMISREKLEIKLYNPGGDIQFEKSLEPTHRDK